MWQSKECNQAGCWTQRIEVEMKTFKLVMNRYESIKKVSFQKHLEAKQTPKHVSNFRMKNSEIGKLPKKDNSYKLTKLQQCHP